MCIVYAVQCTLLSTFMLYTHFIYAQVEVYNIICAYNAMYMYRLYIFIQDTGYTTHICCVKCIRYKYIVDVLRKTIRRIEMIDHSFERNFMETAIIGCVKILSPGQIIQFSAHLYLQNA